MCLGKPEVRQTDFLRLMKEQKLSLPASRLIPEVKIARQRRQGCDTEIPPRRPPCESNKAQECIKTIPEASLPVCHCPITGIAAAICKNVTAAAEASFEFMCTVYVCVCACACSTRLDCLCMCMSLSLHMNLCSCVTVCICADTSSSFTD